MARKTQGSKFTRFLSGLVGSRPRLARDKKGKRRDPLTRQSAEQLESRTLLTLVGVDFGGGLTPANWTAFSGTTDTTLLDLTDESGANSGIDLAVDFDTLPGNYDGFSPPAAQLPAHTQSLAGLDGNYEDQGSLGLTFQNLTAGRTYEVYVFAGDIFADTQRVSVTGASQTTFDQPHTRNQLVVNAQPGDSSRPLSSYAVRMSADASGEIQISVTSENGTFLGVAGVAIGSPAPPTNLYLNEIVADLPTGTDNPNEYIELRGLVGQPLNDVYLIFVDGNDSPGQGETRSGSAGIVDLTGASIGTNGLLTIVDDAADPYAIATDASVVNVPGLDIGDASWTALLVHVDPFEGTPPVAGQDLDTGNDGLDALPTGWTIIDGVSVLDGAIGSRSYGPIAFSPTADGLTEAGAGLVTTGFGAATNHVMRAGNTTGSAASDWVAFQLADLPPDLTVAQSTNPAYQAGALITNHVGAVNPTSAAPPPPTVTISILDAFISENGGTTTATVSRNTDTTNPLTVNLFSNDTGEATVVATTTIPAGQTTSAPFVISAVDDAVIDGTQTVTITAQAALHADGTDSIQILDDEATLTISLADAVIPENAGIRATTATVTRNTPPTEPLVVTLLSDDTSEAVVIGTVTIPAGAATSEIFNIDAVDDALIDGTQTATITASGFGHADGTALLDVVDDESTLTVVIAAAEITEGDGPAATTATVTRSTDVSNPLTVNLISTDTSEATVPSSVTIPAGQASVSFAINAVDDSLADGLRPVVIVASAVGHIDGAGDLSVRDNEAAQLVISVVDSQIDEGAGATATTATVSRNTDPSEPLIVNLTSDDQTEATVAATVTIPAGAMTSAPFSIDAVDDQTLDGTQTVSISASATVTGGTGVGLDAGYGTDGVATFTTNAFFTSAAMAVQPDGRAVSAFLNGAVIPVEVVRLNPDGSPDSSFGVNGRTSFDDQLGAPTRILFQTDGKILISGTQGAVIRLNADGSKDTSFADNGLFRTAGFVFGGGSIVDMAIRPNGRILLANRQLNQFNFVQLNTDGSVDTSFGAAGVVADSGASVSVDSIHLLPNGSFVAAGGFVGNNVEVIRYLPNGARDLSFGTGGSVRIDLGTTFYSVRDVLVDPQGRVLVSGDSDFGTDTRYFAARLLNDGTPDTSFATNGLFQLDIGSDLNDQAGQMVLQADGRIVLGGNTLAPGTTVLNDAAFVRLTPDGTLDTSFDEDGIFIVRMPETRNIFQVVGEVAVDRNGDILALIGATNAYAVVRLTSADVVLQGSASIEVLDNDLGRWVPQGPFGATGGQSENASPNDTVSGAIHTVAAHPTNPDILYIGAVNGGVWRTDNATDANPSWIPLTDQMPSLSIGALTLDVSDPTGNTVYAGIGRFSSFGRTGNERLGLLKTTDGGQSWQLLNDGGSLIGSNISGIVANGNNVVISANTSDTGFGGDQGVFRSTDGGLSFTQVSVGTGASTGLPNGAGYDIVADPNNPDTIYAAIGFTVGGSGNGLYKSTDGGASWTKVSDAAVDALIDTSTSNLELAAGQHNNVYAGIIQFGNPVGIFRSGDGGGTWSAMDLPVTFENTGDVGLNPRGSKGPTAADSPTQAELTGGQGSIHFSILADPTDPNLVYVGGDRQPRSNQDAGGFPNSIGALDFSGRLFRGDASQPTGSQWVHLTHRGDLGAAGGGTASSSSPHADSRDMTFDANGNIVEVDDGGVYRRTAPRSNTGDWFALSGDLQVTEAHDVAYDSLSNTFITGNQDNGTTFQPGAGVSTWQVLHGGDGGDVAVDNISLASQNQSVRYTSFQNLGAFRRTVWDANGNLVSTSFPAVSLGGSRLADVAFVTPIEVNTIDPNRLIIQGRFSTYESLDQAATVTDLGAAGNTRNGLDQNAIAYGGRQNGMDNPDVLWVGSGSDVYLRTTNGGTLAPTASDPTFQSIRDLTIDPDDWSSAFVVSAGEVLATSDSGGTWNDVTGNLFSSTLSTEVWSVSYLANAIADAVIVGTNYGVYASFVASLGTWFEMGTGLPHVLMDDMEYNATDDILVLGTLGRGVWSLESASQVLPTTPDVIIGDVTVNEGSGVASFDVSLATPAVNPVTLLLTTSDGTAIGGQDFGPTTAQVTIATGSTTATGTFNVPILNDFVPELAETFTVSVQSVLTGSVGSTSDAGVGTIIDNEATITASVAAAAVNETDGAAATTVTVTRNTPDDAALDVTLLSSDTSEATIAGMVTIPAGQSSVTVDLDTVQDFFVDGIQTVTITPAAAGHLSVSDTVDVLDSDVPSLSVTIAAASINETDGPAATTATVSRNTDPTSPLIVTLVSSDTGEATVIGAVTIPAGQLTSAPFDINAIDELVIDGTKAVSITASAAGFVDGVGVIDVIDNETPLVSLTISDTTIAENGGTADVTAVLSFVSTVDVVVDLAVTGTATGSGVDYTGPAAQLTIPAGQLTSASTTITAVDEGIDEVDETIIVAISGATNATVADDFQNVTATILDGNPPPTVSIIPTNTSEVEGDDITFTLSLSAVSSRDVTIHLAIGGTATGGGVDYTEPPLQVIIPAGQTSATVTVPTTDDAIDEATESVILGITGVINGTAGTPSQVPVQILDGDPTPSVRLSVDRPTILEDFGRAIFTATLSEVSGRDVTVNLLTGGTATGGSDYTVSQTQLLIPAGSLTARTIVSALPDDLDEFDETVTLTISSATNAVVTGTQQAQTTILDADIEPTVTLSSSVSSIAEDGGSFSFLAALNTTSGKDVTVNLLLRGDAVEGTDYTSRPGSPVQVVIPAGSLSAPVDITVQDDSIDEFDELIVIEFVSVVNAVENIVQQASATIIDNDAPPTVTLSVAPGSVAEASGLTSTVTATLSSVSGKDVQLTLGLAGDAVRNSDYTINRTTILIPAGQTTGTAIVQPLDDALNEADEVVEVSILSAVNAATTAGAQQITIIDDESLPQVSLTVDRATIAEASGTAIFTAALSEVSGRDVTVDLLFTGTAVRGTDYSDPGTQIVIPAGRLSASISVTATSDVLDEFDETIVADIETADFADISSVSQAVTTILDDDALPTLTLTANAAAVSEAAVSTSFLFTLSAVSGRDITVDPGVAGTAAVGTDYSDPGAQLVIPAGQLSVSLPVSIINDDRDEFDETIVLSILSVDFATLGTSTQTITILDDDPEPTVTLSIPDASIAEAGGSTTLTATLSAISNKDVTVNLSRGGTAASGVDYSGVNASIVIPAGTLSVSATLTAIDDALDEPNESVRISALSVVNAVWDGSVATTTILDDDVPTLTLTITPNIVNEADGAGAATATLTRNTSTGSQLQVTLTSSDTSEATVQGSIQFPFGQSTVTFPINAVNDLVLDGTQPVTITAASPGFVSGIGQVDVTDATVEVNLEVSTTAASEAGQTVVTVTAQTLGPVVGSQTLDLVVSGTGITSADYILSGTRITIPDGQSSGSVTFTVQDDAVVEAPQEFATITMTSLTNGLAAGTAPSRSVAIADNDAATLSISDVTRNEGNTGSTTFVFTVTLDTQVDTGVTVDYATADDTAISADGDYTPAAGTLSFAGQPGETRTIGVTVAGDTSVELTEAFLLNLSGVQAAGRNVTIGDGQGTGTITNDDAARLSIDDVSVAEGDSGDTLFIFTLTLDWEVVAPVSIDFATAADTADSGDFTATAGTLQFAADTGGAQTMTLQVLVTGDQTVEQDEDFVVDLSGLSAGGLDVILADNQGRGTILNDDSAVLSVSSVTQNEGNSGSSQFIFTVTLDTAVDTPVTVDYATVDGTATTSDSDYVARSGMGLTFSGVAGETRTLAVTVSGDQKVERDEVFELVLRNLAASGRSVALAGPGTGTITNDDAATLSISDAAVLEGQTGTTSVVFTATLNGMVDVPLTVDFATAADTASDTDADYVHNTGLLTFAPNLAGPQTRTLSVQITGDRKVELDETFLVNLSGIAASGRDVTLADSQAVGTIRNDDSATIVVNDVARNEGNSGDTVFTFSATLDAEIDRDVTVELNTADRTALTSDADYVPITGSLLTFTADSGGSQVQTFQVTVRGDTRVERSETFTVNLSSLVANGLNVTVADDQGVGTITNDDTATLSIDDVTLNEGDAADTLFTFTVTLSGEVDTGVGVQFGTSAGTASAQDGDFVSASGSLNFAAGQGSQQTRTLSVTATGDEKVELDEAFFVNLFNVAALGRAVTIADARGVGSIINDDAATVSIGDVTASEGDAGGTVFSFPVMLSAEVDIPVVFDWATADDSATAADGDFIAVAAASSGFVAGSGPGIQTQTLSVLVTGDTKVEQDEVFLVLLSGLTTQGRDVTFSDAQSTGIILNDDSATIRIDDVTQAEGDNGNSSFVFTVTLSNEVDSDISLSYDTAEGTALLLDSDFVANTGNTLTFTANAGAGSQTRTLSVEVAGDRIVERDESFFVNLFGLAASGLNVTLDDPQGQGTIVNDESATVSVDSVVMSEGDTGTQQYVFTITLDTSVDTGVTLTAATADATATAADGDYLPAGSTLTFNGTAGETRTFSVTVNSDRTVERDETFLLNLTGLGADGRDVTLNPSQGIGTIANDDTAALRINDVTVEEGDSGVRDLVFQVTLDGSVDAPVEVSFQTADGTATVADTDYLARTGTLTFAGTIGEVQTVTVPVTGDINVEQDERLLVQLQDLVADGRNVVLADAQGVGTITNDDTVFVTISDATVIEGHSNGRSFLTFTVSRSNTTVPIDINFATSDGTATVADGDYLARTGILSLPAGSPATASIVVEVLGDNRQEASETMFVDITSTSFGTVISDGRGQGTIVQDDGYVSGQKWHDLDEDGVKDANEPGLNGWEIQVLDQQGVLVASAVTASVDLNQDGVIDPSTEQGLYTIPVGDGTWSVAEVLAQGWRQTHPDGGNTLAYELDQQLGLRFTGRSFENWGGLGEKWLFGDGGWYFITPVGELFRWNGSPQTALTGEFLGAPGSEFHAAPSLLFNAQPPGNRTVTVVAGQTTTGIDFGNTPTGRIEGRKFHDVDADGRHDVGEPWLNGWTVTLHDQAGTVLATTVTQDLDINGDGQIDPELERGVYRFSRLVPGVYSVTEEMRPQWTQGGANGLFAGEAFALNQERSFRPAKNDFLNWGGRNEKWLWSSIGWHFVTPDGSIYEWDGSPRTALTGRLVTRFNASYWQNLSLVHNAPRPNDYLVTITGQEATGLDFANTLGHDGTGSGNVQVFRIGADVSLIGDDQANTLVVYVATDGRVMAQGAGGTTVNGSAAAVSLGSNGTVGSLNVSLNGGNDQLVMIDINATGLTVQTGAGNDHVVASQIDAADTRLENSAGRDERRIGDSRTAGLTVNGDGLISLQDTLVNGGLNVVGGNLGSTVFVQRSEVRNAVSVRTGTAADTVIANRSVFGSSVTVDGGSGSDLLALRASQVAGALVVDGRGGNDTFGLNNGSTVGGAVTLRGGSGTDTVIADGSTAGAQLGSIENRSSSGLENLIDLALSSFDDLLLDV